VLQICCLNLDFLVLIPSIIILKYVLLTKHQSVRDNAIVRCVLLLNSCLYMYVVVWYISLSVCV